MRSAISSAVVVAAVCVLIVAGGIAAQQPKPKPKPKPAEAATEVQSNEQPAEPANSPHPDAPANAPAAAAEVPVKAVVLYSSGVGYFEHFGNITGDGATELRFKTEQINDVLKSLVLQDLDGGRAGTVSYPSQEPIARTLKSFQVDITNNPPLADLLNQLRGAQITITAGGITQSGAILGIEKRKKAVGEKGQVEEQNILTLKVGRKVRTIALDAAEEFQLEDPQLDAELDKALSALAGARDQDKKPVHISFRGEGERRVRLGYVVETPIWKTSYRLILSDKNKPDDGAKENKAALKAPGANAAAGQGGYLQGWAIVENQTDNDWDNVQLSLVSGRPISFIQDLYHPLYVPRPVVYPELYASLRPQTYEGGMTPEEEEQMRAQMEEDFEDAPNYELRSGPPSEQSGGGGGAGLFAGSSEEEEELEEAMDPAASVRSMASAGRIGELFQYTVPNVSIQRQRSAMIPIITEPLEVEKLSIFNQSVLATHPLNGARVKNTTSNHLLQGPITVLEAGAYAGDARIDDVPPGQERLVSYGVDLETLVQVEDVEDDGVIQTGRIVNGSLEVVSRRTWGRKYVAQNKGASDKTLVIEHPRDEDWKLIDPAKAEEQTDTLYRFTRPLPAGESATLTVRLQAHDTDYIALLRTEPDRLAFYHNQEAIPEPVRAALAKAMELQRALAGLTREAEMLNKRIDAVRTEQSHIRENMKAVSPETDYYQRLVGKLDEQESQVEKMQAEAATLQEQAEETRKQLADYVKDLEVG